MLSWNWLLSDDATSLLSGPNRSRRMSSVGSDTAFQSISKRTSTSYAELGLCGTLRVIVCSSRSVEALPSQAPVASSKRMLAWPVLNGACPAKCTTFVPGADGNEMDCAGGTDAKAWGS